MLHLPVEYLKQDTWGFSILQFLYHKPKYTIQILQKDTSLEYVHYHFKKL